MTTSPRPASRSCGRRRVESDRFIALRSHYLYESQFALAGVAGAHEKGGVEGEVGRFRRRHLVPVPDVGTLGELNERMLRGCESVLERRITGRAETVGEPCARERPLHRVLPSDHASTAEESTPRVDSKALVTIKQNRYSVPVRLAGLRVRASVGAREMAPDSGDIEQDLTDLFVEIGEVARAGEPVPPF